MRNRKYKIKKSRILRKYLIDSLITQHGVVSYDTAFDVGLIVVSMLRGSLMIILFKLFHLTEY